MTGFVNVGRLDEFPLGRGRVVKVRGVAVAVFRLENRCVALADACPHMGASLADGRIAGNTVVCHWHGWKFDLDTGQGDARQWACARVYAVRLEPDGGVWLRPSDEPAPTPAEPPPELIPWDPERYFKKKE